MEVKILKKLTKRFKKINKRILSKLNIFVGKDAFNDSVITVKKSSGDESNAFEITTTNYNDDYTAMTTNLIKSDIDSSDKYLLFQSYSTTAQEYISNNNKLFAKDLCPIINGMIESVKFMHKANVVHNEIALEKFLIEKNENKTYLALSDFRKAFRKNENNKETAHFGREVANCGYTKIKNGKKLFDFKKAIRNERKKLLGTIQDIVEKQSNGQTGTIFSIIKEHIRSYQEKQQKKNKYLFSKKGFMKLMKVIKEICESELASNK